MTKERDVNAPGSGHNLRNYWVRGEGAVKIGWGTDGSFARCVALLGEHVKNPQGLCAEYHKAATGEWPAEKGVKSEVETTAFLFRKSQKRGPDGRWIDEDNPIGLGSPDRPSIPNELIAKRDEISREMADESRSLRDRHRREGADLQREHDENVRKIDHETLAEVRALDLHDDLNPVYRRSAERSLTESERFDKARAKLADRHKRDLFDLADRYDKIFRKAGIQRIHTPLMSYSTRVYASTEGGDDTVTTVTAADKTPYGDVPYADPGYQDDGVKRYPLDTDAHVRAAWSYINVPKNADKYSAQELRRVKARIERAMKRIGAEVAEDTTAAGGQVVVHTVAAEDGDCPPGHHMMSGGKCMPDSEMESYALETAEAPAGGDAPWNGVLTVEGVESGDGRMFGAQSLSWDEPPLPLMWQKETSHGGSNDVSVRVGSIDKIWREPDPSGRSDVFFIKGEGRIDLGNPDGAEVHRRMIANHLRGNSVDVDSVKETDVELSYPEVTADVEGGNPLQAVFAQPDLTTYRRGRIRATTLVEIPAFTEARLQLSDAVTAAAFHDCTECADETAEADVDATSAALTAATSRVEIPDLPPREWFLEPTDVTPQGALTVTHEGRVYGYVAPAGVRHRTFRNRSVYVPMRNVDYGRFHGGETLVADGGRVTTGNITMNCGHATTARKLSGSEANEHYENSCSIVATAAVGENEHGVWIAGALLPDVDAASIRRMMACRLSGDWRTHLDRAGWREFVAALLVPVPGFPMGRVAPSVQISEGELVASAVPVRLETAAGIVTYGTLRQERVAAAARRVAVMRRTDRIAELRARVHGVA